MRTVAAKELKVLWTSPLPYVLGAVFHATFGVLGWGQIGARGLAVFQPLVPIAGFLILLAAPLVAMRAFAEEARAGTLELLLAVPVRPGRLVAGKYAAVLVTLLAIVAPAGLFAVLLSAWGSPDPGPIFTGLLGLALLCAALGAVGVLASALTESQAVAAVGGLFGVLVLWFAHAGSEVAGAGRVMALLAVSERLRAFAGGVIELSDTLYFVTVAAVSLVAAAAAVGRRR